MFAFGWLVGVTLQHYLLFSQVQDSDELPTAHTGVGNVWTDNVVKHNLLSTRPDSKGKSTFLAI